MTSGDATVTDTAPAYGDGGAQLTLWAGGDAAAPAVVVGGGIGAFRDAAAWAVRTRELEALRRQQVPRQSGGRAKLTLMAAGQTRAIGGSHGGARLSLSCAGTATAEEWLTDEELLAIVMAA